MRIKFLLFLLLSVVCVYGQSDMTVLTGRVVDRQSGKKLAHVSVSSPNGKQQTVTNDDGEFLLKTPDRPAYIVKNEVFDFTIPSFEPTMPPMLYIVLLFTVFEMLRNPVA